MLLDCPAADDPFPVALTGKRRQPSAVGHLLLSTSSVRFFFVSKICADDCEKPRIAKPATCPA
jgi:hypothetical protein